MAGTLYIDQSLVIWIIHVVASINSNLLWVNKHRGAGGLKPANISSFYLYISLYTAEIQDTPCPEFQ